MSPQAREVLAEALKLSPMERAELVEKILASFPFPDRAATDEKWAAEAEERIDAFDRGEIQSKPAGEGPGSGRPPGREPRRTSATVR